jgi:hypothetical protein
MAAHLGRIGGKATSPTKAAAVRANGKLGVVHERFAFQMLPGTGHKVLIMIYGYNIISFYSYALISFCLSGLIRRDDGARARHRKTPPAWPRRRAGAAFRTINAEGNGATSPPPLAENRSRPRNRNTSALPAIHVCQALVSSSRTSAMQGTRPAGGRLVVTFPYPVHQSAAIGRIDKYRPAPRQGFVRHSPASRQ